MQLFGTISAAGLVLLLAGEAVSACVQPSGGESVVAVGVTPFGDIETADGRLLKLAGLRWPLEDAQAGRRLVDSVRRMVQGGAVFAEVTGAQDRWRRRSAQLYVAVSEGRIVWLQGQLLENGIAEAWPDRASASCKADILEHEMLARTGGLGRWSALGQRRHAAVIAAMRSEGRALETVYEGVVRSVRRGRSMTFVNFNRAGRNAPGWFVPERLKTELARAGIDLARLPGKRLRLRAELQFEGRPRMFVRGAEAVDVIE